MKLHLECIPCFIKQTVQVAKTLTDDGEKIKTIIKEGLNIAQDFEKYNSSPEMAPALHNAVKTVLNISDPYRDMKKAHIESSKKLLPLINDYIKKSEDTLLASLKASASGNVIDAAVYSDIKVAESIIDEFDKCFSNDDYSSLRYELQTAKRILIIGDNAGESVFDTVLLNELQDYELFYSVRGLPIINDVIFEDAVDSGIDRYANIISTGIGLPGVIVDDSSDEFKQIYNSADIIISKGQGNYETLSDNKRGIYFLLKAKCPIVANDIGVNVNDYVFIKK